MPGGLDTARGAGSAAPWPVPHSQSPPRGGLHPRPCRPPVDRRDPPDQPRGRCRDRDAQSGPRPRVVTRGVWSALPLLARIHRAPERSRSIRQRVVRQGGRGVDRGGLGEAGRGGRMRFRCYRSRSRSSGGQPSPTVSPLGPGDALSVGSAALTNDGSCWSDPSSDQGVRGPRPPGRRRVAVASGSSEPPLAPGVTGKAGLVPRMKDHRDDSWTCLMRHRPSCLTSTKV
jgi:hypothetical protein